MPDPQKCHDHTVWSYARVSCRHLDYLHIDTTRNLRTKHILDRWIDRLSLILDTIESMLPSDLRVDELEDGYDSDRKILNHDKKQILLDFKEKLLKQQLLDLIDEKHFHYLKGKTIFGLFPKFSSREFKCFESYFPHDHFNL